MGLDTFPLLKDQTLLITCNNNVFKLKLEYQEMSQEKKEIFVQVVSEQAAHCQIEDVCRALLYSIEREEQLSSIQTDNFIIYPEVHKWPLAKKVLFTIDGKPLSCHQDLILLKLTCKDVAVSKKDHVVVSPFSERKLPSCRSPHDKSKMRATNNQTNKTVTTIPHEDTYTDNSTAHKTVTCVRNGAGITNTPVIGINNNKGDQSPESLNKITTIIQKHYIKTPLPTTNDQINLARLSRNKPTQYNKISSETHQNIIVPEPDRCTNQRTKLAQEKNKKEELVRIMNTDKGRSKGSSCDSPQDDSAQDKDKQINTNIRPSPQRTRKGFNKTMQKKNSMQLEVERNEISEDNNKLRLSGSNYGLIERDLTESSPLSGSQSNNSHLCSSEQSGDGNVLNKEKLALKMVTRLESQKRKNVTDTFMHQGIMKNKSKHIQLQKQKRRTLRNKADGLVVKSLNTEMNKNSSESWRTHKTSSETECSENKIINETSTRNMKYQSQVGEKKQYNKSLDIARKNVAEISDDGSIINDSEQMNYFGSNYAITPTVAVKDQNMKRKNSSSSKYSEREMGRQLQCSSTGLSHERADEITAKHMSNVALISDHNVTDCGTPAKRQMRSSKAQMREYCSNFGSIKSKGQQLNVRRNIERYSNINSSFSSSTSKISSNRSEQDSGLYHGHRYTGFNGSTIAAHSSQISGVNRQTRLYAERSLSDSSKITRSHRNAKECIIRNHTGIIKRSKNHKEYNRKNVVDVKIQKKVATDFDSEKIQSTMHRTNSSTLNSSKRALKSLSVSPSMYETRSFRSAQSKKTNLSNSSEMSSKRSDTSRAGRKLLKAQQQLLKSKDGVWLLWKP